MRKEMTNVLRRECLPDLVVDVYKDGQAMIQTGNDQPVRLSHASAMRLASALDYDYRHTAAQRYQRDRHEYCGQISDLKAKLELERQARNTAILERQKIQDEMTEIEKRPAVEIYRENARLTGEIALLRKEQQQVVDRMSSDAVKLHRVQCLYQEINELLE